MKKFPLIIPIIILLAACTKEEKELTQYTTYDYRIYIKGNRIMEMDYLFDDTIFGITKYYFSNTQVRVVSFGQDTTLPESYILYDIGENGYAESSVEYPESIRVINDADSFFF